ncbi:hypothetical protein F0L74_08155 [Chitinophaga agrisoli]|uniref:Dolichyl-phosphate-mannose-protein mannosyltransferase n=1 Tax=Chitinophaga agrisoli TaxID=2607653 RepID=A0A5B2VTZ0_9BACT|nr:hypothetical protein [Chitinophaga agrisoli]KAA2242505.1 hypothetical protein F0L74_08155 [Chitinophaga agrisoli]
MQQRYVAWLVIITLASRLAFKLFFHLEFDMSHLWIGWQIIDPQLLQHHLLQSIWYLHSQPPLYNLFLGIVLKLFPLHYAAVLELSYLLLGLLQSLLLYRSMVLLTQKAVLSFTIAGVFAVSPCLVLYENWLFYTFPGMCMLSISVYLLLRFLQTRRAIWCFAFFILLGALALTISMFHLCWLLFIAAGLPVLCRRQAGTILLAAAGPLLLVSAWYYKNLLVFGFWGASSWFGMNISRIMLPPGPAQQYKSLHLDSMTRQLVAQGPFKPLCRYKPFIPLYHGPLEQVPVLQQECKSNGDDNFNNINYLLISQRFQQGAVHSLKYRANRYLHRVLIANTLYFSPASDYFHLEKNRKRIARYNALFNLGDIRIWHGYIGIMNILLGGITMLVLFASLLYCCRQKKNGANTCTIVIAFTCFNILFVLVTGNLLEIGENMRFRFMTLPLFLLLSAMLYVRVRQKYLRKFTRNV